MVEQQLNWAIIGCGDVVKNKSGPSIQQAGHSRIVAIMATTRGIEQAKEYAQTHNIPTATCDLDVILTSPETDIVYVATPPNCHAEYAIAAAKAGKHVLVEKPMAFNARQGQQMIEACGKAGVELFVAYYRRFYPTIEKMRQLIDEGKIGTVVQAFVDIACGSPGDTGWRQNPQISSGGFFIDLGSHRIDAMVSLLGDIDQVTGVASSFDNDHIEQAVSLSLKFKSGAQCTVTGDFYSGRTADKFCIFGTTGCILADPLNAPEFILQTEKGPQQFTFEELPAPHLGLIRHIEDVLAGKAQNRSSGADALITERVLDIGVRDYYRNFGKQD